MRRKQRCEQNTNVREREEQKPGKAQQQRTINRKNSRRKSQEASEKQTKKTNGTTAVNPSTALLLFLVWLAFF
jgi:hypothetical protein